MLIKFQISNNIYITIPKTIENIKNKQR